LVMSGALANLNVVLDQNLQQNSQERGQELMGHLEDLMSQYDFIGEVRGKGLALALEMVKDRETKQPDPERTAALLEASKKHGLLIGKGGFYGNVIRLTPPMSITKAEVAEAKDRLDATFASV